MQMPHKSRINICLSQKTRGLTLVELLVVITIIALLLGILLPAIAAVMNSSQRKICAAEINQIETALANYETDHRNYPPSTVAKLGIKTDNKVNSGIEALVVSLSSQEKTASYYEFKDDKLQNSDNDSSPIPLDKLVNSVFKKNDLWELTDIWGNPYIYFHSDDLLPTTQQYYDIAGKRVAVTPYTGESKTGNFPGYGKYQVISCGEDAELHSEDDIRSQ